jgi:hypothetical protein
VSGAVLVADNPAGHQSFLKSFTGVGEWNLSSIAVTAHTGNGDIEILEPVSFRDQSGVSSGVRGQGMSLGAMRFAVADIAQAEALHRQNRIASQRHGGRLVVPPDIAHGATLIFETALIFIAYYAHKTGTPLSVGARARVDPPGAARHGLRTPLRRKSLERHTFSCAGGRRRVGAIRQ